MTKAQETEPSQEMQIWEGYYRRRRYWFVGVVPALLVVLGINLFETSAPGLIAGVSVALIVVAMLVVVERRRIRRTAQHLTSSQATFCGEAIILGDAIVGSVEPWSSLQVAARHKQLGLAGLLSLDPQGLHWVSSVHRRNLRIDLRPVDIDRYELRQLGWWMSGLAVWTITGERLAVLLPRLDRQAAERSLAGIGADTAPE